MAIIIKCIVAAKTAEADFIFITGTDAWGAAQTESLDVTAGNGTYTTTKRFQTITNLDCSDNAAGGGAVWADGTIQVTQDVWGVIWDFGNGQYQIDCQMYIGDNVISTYFKDINKSIVFPSSNTADPLIWYRGNATLHLGTKISSTRKSTKDGCYLYAKNTTSEYHIFRGSAGSLYLYSCLLKTDATTAGDLYNLIGGGEIWNCLLDRVNIYTITDFNLYNVTLTDVFNSIRDPVTTTFDLINIKEPRIQSLLSSAAASTFSNLIISNALVMVFNGVYEHNLIDCTIDNWVVRIAFGSGEAVNRKYTCNIHFADKDGANLAGVTALCEDKDGNEIFSVVADANGDIAEQQIIYQSWEEQANPSTTIEHSPHKFTISYPGLETLVMDNVTVDAPIVWEQELQPLRARNYARSRVQGVQFQ